MQVNVISNERIARASVHGHHCKAKTWLRAMAGAILKYRTHQIKQFFSIIKKENIAI